ncbi:MAG: CHAP domain-containing protein [Bdellovibrionales bacterium]
MNEQALRRRIVDTFQGYVGIRESGAENSGTLVSQFLQFAGINYPAEWCASFFSYAMQGAVPEMLDPEHAVIRIREQYQEAGAFFTSGNVQPGDAIFFTRGNEGWQGHIGVVESINRRDRILYLLMVTEAALKDREMVC